MARIGIIGSKGRMGRAIADLLAEDSRNEYAGGVDQEGDVTALAAQSDILVDFSAPAATAANLNAAVEASIAIVIGTTGLTDAQHQAIDRAAQHIAILQTGNTSLGVTLLAHLVQDAASRLGPDWDIEVVEMHHRNKVDAPSGTALLLGEAAAAGRKIELDGNRESGRDGQTGKRQQGAIGFAALRGGTVTGEHAVIIAGEQERLTLAHSAENREIFARGAIRAAEWLIEKPPGRYTMPEVLGL